MSYFDLARLKSSVLESAQRYYAEYTAIDSENAYNFAVARCGFSNPASTDTDYVVKQYWLIEMMKLWFYRDIRDRYLLKFDVGDLKLSQATRNINAVIELIEKAFEQVRSDEKMAAIFFSATDIFADDSVVDNGLQDDAVGQDYRE